MARACAGIWLALALLSTGPVWADDALWEALAEGGHVALMRHARAPGTGDPADFQLNLDQTGRAVRP